MDNIFSVVTQFSIKEMPVNAVPYGNGHINSTYLVSTEKDDVEVKYILQKINNNVFTNVDGLMNNIVLVTNHIINKMIEQGETTEDALRVIKTKDGKDYYFTGNGECYRLYNYITDQNAKCIKADDGNYYRLYNFIKSGISIETTATIAQFHASGVGFGRFQKYLDGFDANKLLETIPNFHNTKARYENFEKAIKDNLKARYESVKEDCEKFLKRKSYCNVVLDLIEKKEIPLRVTHNDTKLNNVLINVDSLEPVAVIDLDTVMPGSMLYDFGDSIRFGASTAAEDERDLSKVQFSLELFEAYTDGFMSELADRMTEKEIELLAFGAILMTYECGMRFLTDHLNGDTYFRIHRENHNLDRARTQIKLVEEMEKKLPEMNEIVARCAKKYK